MCMLVARSNLRVVTEVTRSLEFSPLMHSMADRVVTAIAARSPEYNAVHLRIEKDARDWSQIMGGPEVWMDPSPARSCCPVASCWAGKRRKIETHPAVDRRIDPSFERAAG